MMKLVLGAYLDDLLLWHGAATIQRSRWPLRDGRMNWVCSCIISRAVGEWDEKASGSAYCVMMLLENRRLNLFFAVV